MVFQGSFGPLRKDQDVSVVPASFFVRIKQSNEMRRLVGSIDPQ